MMTKILIFLLLITVLSLLAISMRKRVGTTRIIGGFDAPEGLYPYQVSLQVKDSHNCGGSIISKDYVLTTGHCINRENITNMKAVVGITRLSDSGSKHAILEAHTHEKWDKKNVKNDIAVLKVEEITFSSKVAPIPLDTGEIEILDNMLCTVSGWGFTSYPIPIVFPNHLQHINFTTISLEKCKKIKNLLIDITKEICILPKNGEGVCFADSGSPLVRNDDGVKKQIGIVSLTECGMDWPEVFVRVSSYIDWIKEKCEDCI